MDTVVYAGYSRDTNLRMKSSSGGVYGLLAKYVLAEHGVVFAACYDEQFEVVHKEIQTEEDLMGSLGSKYVQSRLGDTFIRIKNQLEEGQMVLFVGTGCQCGGLKSFLHKEYEKLICADFICHGVPSRSVWRRYLKTRNPKDSLQSVNMRDKTNGWSRYNFNWKLKYKNGNEIIEPQGSVPYIKGFLNDFYLRPSCYECRFRGESRQTDITLGDFWGVWNIQPHMDDNKGTSLILIHSEKGMELFRSISSDLIYEEADIKQAVLYNPNLLKDVEKPAKRELFYKRFLAGDNIDAIIKELLWIPLWKRILRKGKRMMKKQRI